MFLSPPYSLWPPLNACQVIHNRLHYCRAAEQCQAQQTNCLSCLTRYFVVARWAGALAILAAAQRCWFTGNAWLSAPPCCRSGVVLSTGKHGVCLHSGQPGPKSTRLNVCKCTVTSVEWFCFKLKSVAENTWDEGRRKPLFGFWRGQKEKGKILYPDEAWIFFEWISCRYANKSCRFVG